jgi:putative phosphoesterase
VLAELGRLAPVTAVRGNTDVTPWSSGLPTTAVVEVDGRLVYVLHDLGRLDLFPEAAGFGAVVFGHSHRPDVREREGVLYLNPGSAGPRRFDLPVTVMRLGRSGGRWRPELVRLDAPTPAGGGHGPRRPGRGSG